MNKIINLDELKCPVCGKKMVIRKVAITRDAYYGMASGEIIGGEAYTTFEAECKCGLKMDFKSPNYECQWSKLWED